MLGGGDTSEESFLKKRQSTCITGGKGHSAAGLASKLGLGPPNHTWRGTYHAMSPAADVNSLNKIWQLRMYASEVGQYPSCPRLWIILQQLFSAIRQIVDLG